MADQDTGRNAAAAGFGTIPGAEAMLASLASWTAAMPQASAAGALSDATLAEALRQAKTLTDRDPLLRSVDAMWNANPLREVIPVDWGEVARALRLVWMQSLSDPASTFASATALGANVWRAALDAWTEAGQRWLGDVAPEAKASADKRFAAPEWQANPVFRTLKEAYLHASDWLLQRGKASAGLDPAERQRLEFHLRQFVDAMSPTLLLASNPVALKRAMETGGASLASGARNLLEDVQAGRLSMVDAKAFAPGRNLAMTPGKVVHRNKLVELIQYAPQTETVHARPLLILPPWINKFYIMDMQPKNSLIGFLVKQGFTVFVVSWKNPDASMEETSIEDYMDLGVLETSDVVREITGSDTLNVMGYCIGGTLLAMVLAWLAAGGDKRFASATFMVSLQDFSRVGDTAVFLGEGAIDSIEAQMMQRGYLDSREMSNMFNLLRSNDLIWANVVNNYLLGEKPPAFDLLYWNSDGTRMCRAAHAWYLRNTYVDNNLITPGRIVLKGRPLDLGAIKQDIYAVGAEKDHIVPWDAAWQITRLAGGKVRYILGSSGHIAGIINPPGGKGSYWTSDEPAKTAETWRRGATKHDGSWWHDWAAWLAQHAGRKGKPPALGSAAHPPLADAPGTYVLEK
ncbi:PHA/PHB synthase family protein [Roseicella frigidaeris]|uniref:Class I poly(R)-hydroxyalkanoic acid synthase n=1 Tax=Roseicella frigidaeris TaxID=2230885 RepID=A0A327M585_9PROT|nr:class I poly(R)-hydroxyalkanoic acid synthase [Roseicella frigidaeris]RAI57536.1 class I poly(R)-hydroxyalkanoic acid synthase [Roseicella frigidaeris]